MTDLRHLIDLFPIIISPVEAYDNTEMLPSVSVETVIYPTEQEESQFWKEQTTKFLKDA